MKKTYKIEGMHCNSCATSVELALEDKEGVRKVEVDFASEKAEVDFDENEISDKEIKAEITKLGYKIK
jgi:P-type Cu+ transporter